jgi:hypothetical protein
MIESGCLTRSPDWKLAAESVSAKSSFVRPPLQVQLAGMNKSTNINHFIDPISPRTRIAMGRKRKRPSDVSSATIRPNPSQSRAKSFHTTESGRLGQSTSFINVPRKKTPRTEQTTTPEQTASVESDEDLFPDHTCTADFTNDNRPARPIDPPLVEWMKNYRDTYLDEILRHDGRGGVTQCSACKADATYKCKDCFGCQLLCQECYTTKHHLLPFHRALVSPNDSWLIS